VFEVDDEYLDPFDGYVDQPFSRKPTDVKPLYPCLSPLEVGHLGSSNAAFTLPTGP
jgi:hypothetical protein